jgi:uncharacterized protein (TIGR00269 family)
MTLRMRTMKSGLSGWHTGDKMVLPFHQENAKKCSRCDEPAVIRYRNPERHLCGSHLNEHVRECVIRTIERDRLISPGDHIAVALSGGKDSTALLVLLHQILRGYPDVSMSAITIDEGITGYRDETVHSAEELAAHLGVKHCIMTFSDLFGDDLDTLLVGREKEACAVCGVLRRRALVRAAQQVAATKIATGHNLDDEAQSVLMNVLRGDLPRLMQDTSPGNPVCFIPRIKPLSALTEKEIATFLFIQGHFPDLPECPYAGYALRSEVRTMLSGLENVYPGTMNNLIRSRDKIRTRMQRAGKRGSFHSCRECGDPCSGEICQVCRMVRTRRGA